MAEQIYKVIIVGAGPGGLSAAARAKENQLEYLIFDKGELGNTLYEDYQFGKFVQAFPSTIPARSDLSFQAGSREEILGRNTTELSVWERQEDREAFWADLRRTGSIPRSSRHFPMTLATSLHVASRPDGSSAFSTGQSA